MKRALCLIIVVLLFVNVSSAQMKSSWQGKSSSVERSKRAEQLVSRAVNKFAQTLDFKDVFQEAFVKDRADRRRANTPLLEGFIDGKLMETLDDATLERAYIKSQNLYWLFMVYSMQQDSNDVSEIERGIVTKLNKRQQIFYRRMMSENESSSAKTRAELDDCLAIYETMAAALRQKITPKFRRTLRNKTSTAVKRTMPANATDYSPKQENFFNVTLKINAEYTPFTFSVVEKSGAMKILSVSIDD